MRKRIQFHLDSWAEIYLSIGLVVTGSAVVYCFYRAVSG